MPQSTLATQHTKQLFIIDKKIGSWQDLASNIGTDAAILLLDPSQDGLTQIAEAITAYTNIDAVHIFSHGSAGSLQLGSATTLKNTNYRLQASTMPLVKEAICCYMAVI
jgi:hypothetical protein